jgi:hypothetical protein
LRTVALRNERAPCGAVRPVMDRVFPGKVVIKVK